MQGELVCENCLVLVLSGYHRVEVPISNQVWYSIAEQYFEIFIALALLQVDSVSLADSVCNVNFNALCLVYDKKC